MVSSFVLHFLLLSRERCGLGGQLIVVLTGFISGPLGFTGVFGFSVVLQLRR